MPQINSVAAFMQLVGKYQGDILTNPYLLVACEATVTINVTLTGDIRGHTLSWQQISGTTVAFTESADKQSITFQQTQIADDKTFVFWLDYGLPHAIGTYILVSAKPTEYANVVAIPGSVVGLGVGPNPTMIGSISHQIPTSYTLSPVTPLPTLNGVVELATPAFTEWEISFAPPADNTYFSSFNISQNIGQGFKYVGATIPFVVGNYSGLTQRPFAFGSTLAVQTNYFSPGGYSVNSPPIPIKSSGNQAAAAELAQLGNGVSVVTPVVQLSSLDYSVSVQLITDPVLSVAVAPGQLSTDYTTTINIPTTAQGGAIITITSATSSYTAYDYRNFVQAASDTSFVGVSTSVVRPIITYTAAGSGIISLG